MSHSIPRVWLVDADPAIRWVLERALGNDGMLARVFAAAESALEALQSEAPNVLITEIQLAGQSGLELLKTVRAIRPELPVIVIAARSDLSSAVLSYQAGAFEYLPKPFDIVQVVALVKRASHAHPRGNGETDTLPRIPEILGRAPAMQLVFRAIGRLARSSVTVLITGESGTGKELAARALHNHSPRADRPFIALNTAAIPADLLESELFGHEKGAFTGATVQRRGRFEQADGGTLFLDEIGDMPTQLQTRLLRVLAEGEFYRVGGQLPLRADVRVIAATHQDLYERVQLGLFRGDLYYRLNVIRIELPPLRSRAEDIPELVSHYMQSAARELGVEPKSFAADAMNKLADYDWPGNVRELANLCRRLCVLAPGREIGIDDLPPGLAASNPADPADAEWTQALAAWADRKLTAGEYPLLAEAQPEFERVLMRSALKHTQGHRQEAAKLMGWGRNTLARKVRALDTSEIDGEVVTSSQSRSAVAGDGTS